MGSFEMYIEGNKIKVYETHIEPLIFTQNEFLNYMKYNKDTESKYRGLIGLIHEEFQYNTDERLYKLMCKDVELVCNTMFEYLK